MLKAQEVSIKPFHLLQPNIREKQIFIFITSSEHSFWIKENQNDWEEVKIDNMEVLKDGGSISYYFKGKEYNKLYIPSSLKRNHPCYISGNSESVKLEKIPLSKQKLEKIGIINKVELDLSNISETTDDAEKALTGKLDKSRKLSTSKLANFFTNDQALFFDMFSEDSQETSETSESATSTSSDPRFTN